MNIKKSITVFLNADILEETGCKVLLLLLLLLMMLLLLLLFESSIEIVGGIL
jgi:hypothetical protein